MDKRKRNKKTIVICGAVLLGICLLYFGGGTLAGLGVFHAVFDRRLSDLETLNKDEYCLWKTQKDFSNLTERKIVNIKNGDHELTSYLYMVKDPKGIFISAHGMGSLADGEGSSYLSFLVENHFNVLALDLTASGRSEGDSMISLEQSRFDVLSAEDYIEAQEELNRLPLGLIGHSWGAYGCLSSLQENRKPSWVISFSAFNDPLTFMVESAKQKIGRIAETTLPTFHLSYACRYGKWDAIKVSDACKNLTSTKILFIQGEEDEVVPLSQSAYQACHTKGDSSYSFLSLPNVGHDAPWFDPSSLNYFTQKMTELHQEKLGLEEWEKGIDKEKSNVLNPIVISEISNLIARS